MSSLALLYIAKGKKECESFFYVWFFGLCPGCKIVGDEFHFLLNCQINKNLRDEYMHNILMDYPDFNNVKNPSTPSQVNN